MSPSSFVALLAGLVSFLSPCVLPLVPAYLAVLTGGVERTTRSTAIRRALLFILGFSAVFILLGLGASAIGRALWSYRAILIRFGGIVLILLGLQQVGLFHLLPLYQERRFAMPRGGSDWAAVAIGAVFAFGWTPCVGPVLATILTLAGTSGRMIRGAALLTLYSVGLGLPFLAAALGYESLLGRLKQMGRIARYIEAFGGGLLLLLGLLMIFGRLDLLQQVIG